MNYEQKVREFITEKFLFGEDDKLTNETSLYDTGIIDSTGMLEIIAFLEETFNIRIEDDELIPGNLENIKCITKFLERKLNEE